MVRARREALGIGTKQAFNEGVSHTTVNQLELGQLDNISTDRLAAIESLLSARWEVRLVPDEQAEMSAAARDFIDRVNAVADQFDDDVIKHLGLVLGIYETQHRERAAKD